VKNLLILLTLVSIVACTPQKEENHQTVKDTKDETIPPERDSILTFDHLSIKPVNHWYADYDTITKRDILVKGLGVRERKDPSEAVELVNTFSRVPVALLKTVGDTIFVKLNNSHVLTEQSGSAGSWGHLASLTFTLTEMEGVEFVDYDFVEGSHLSPGVYSRKDFTNFSLIENESRN
jgi:hypothetical protein